ncbi:MAG: endopeptidase La [Oscillospiraceae bacterium]|jgi:ATP-dependent Lon protease|nr:endopeptidase La [Oscillospiraceae bacterium]
MNDIAHPVQGAAYPLLPMRGLSVFPEMLINFDVIRPKSVAALNSALEADRMIFIVAQRDISKEIPAERDLYAIGTICRIKQLLRIPGTEGVRVLVEGYKRARINRFEEREAFHFAEVSAIEDGDARYPSAKAEALLRQCLALFGEYAHLFGALPPELLAKIANSDKPGYVADFIAQNIYMKPEKKQALLEELNPLHRVQLLSRFLTREIAVLSIEQDLNERTHEQMSQSQKDFFLREQMKLIQAELGEFDETYEDFQAYRKKIYALKLADELAEKLLKEVSRLAKQPAGSSESAVLRNYLDTCLELPWNKKTRESIDIAKARKVLDDDHFGLEKVKDRIIEYLAVKQLSPGLKGTVLCLVGPPGTGKTSVAMSIARATNRRFARISLGGVHDEAEIRGHRKTYVGAMPGRIIAGIEQAGSANPLMLLDEVDKLAGDYRGDPAAALLEALDFEQNHGFRDHYIELPFDLSDTMFITTANTTETIPRALLDRMEVITLSSYTDEEKLEIAKRHLIPKQRKKHGLAANRLKLSDDAIRELIARYTKESGVRNLEREIAAICRKTAKRIAGGQAKSLSLRAGMLEGLLGPAKFKPDLLSPSDEIGLVRGLAWTSAGGAVLDVEASVLDGAGSLELTGNLGDVMKESARAAVSYIRSRADVLGIQRDFYKTKDIHIHFPEGAVPKDGPSAGITICIAVTSALTGIPVRRDVAMTGEISLRGRVMPIGGLREKTMAALRSGIKTVIIPAENETDLEEIDQTVRRALNFVTTDHVDKILDIALNRSISFSVRSAAQEDEALPFIDTDATVCSAALRQ